MGKQLKLPEQVQLRDSEETHKSQAGAFSPCLSNSFLNLHSFCHESHCLPKLWCIWSKCLLYGQYAHHSSTAQHVQNQIHVILFCQNSSLPSSSPFLFMATLILIVIQVETSELSPIPSLLPRIGRVYNVNLSQLPSSDKDTRWHKLHTQ